MVSLVTSEQISRWVLCEVAARRGSTETKGLVVYINLYIYELFGLGRFAKDHSLTKADRDLCSLVFDATRLKDTTENIIFEISMLDYPIWSLESS